MFDLLNNINIFISYLLSEGKNRFIFALLGGLLLSCSLPAISAQCPGLALIAWIGLIPLLILAKSSHNYSKLCLETILFMMAYYLVAFSWLLGLHPLTWQGFSYGESLAVAGLAWALPSLFHSALTLPFIFVAHNFFTNKSQGSKKQGTLSISNCIVLAFIWVVIEHKLAFILGPLSVLNVPAHLLAYSQHHFLGLIQIANIVGAIGLEFLLVLANLYLSNFFNVKALQGRSSSRISNYNINQPSFSLHNLGEQSILGIGIALVLILSFGYSQNVISQANTGRAKETIKVEKQELLAANSPIAEKEVSNFYSQGEAATTQIQGEPLTTLAKAPIESDWISFKIAQSRLSAEDSRGKKLNSDNIIQIMLDKTNSLYTDAKTDIILWPEGSAPILVSDSIPGQFLGLSNYADLFVFGAYHSQNNKLYNSVGLVDFAASNGATLTYYDKINLVPFGEYTPWLGLLPQAIKDLAKFAIGSGFERGHTKQIALKSSKGRIGCSVCFELLFADLVRKQAEQANILVNLNDLSWFDSRAIESAFLAVARFRAIENAQGLILASNAGTSTGIDTCGRLVQNKLHKTYTRSIYNLYGW